MIYFVITPLRLLRLHHNYIGTPPLFLYKARSVYRTVPHISISTLHKSGINIISIFQHSSITTITSILSFNMLFFKNSHVSNSHVLFFILFSRILSFTFAILRRSIVWQDHPPFTGNVFNECLFRSGPHAKCCEGIRIYFLTSQFFSLSDSIVLFLLVFINCTVFLVSHFIYLPIHPLHSHSFHRSRVALNSFVFVRDVNDSVSLFNCK